MLQRVSMLYRYGQSSVFEMLFLWEFKILPARNFFFEDRQLGTEDYRMERERVMIYYKTFIN